MKIAIIGYGKMGNMISKLAVERGHEVVTIDPVVEADFKDINEESLKDVDVCIEFTVPDQALDNIKKIAAQKKNMVIGTTGWYDQIDEVKKLTKGLGFIYSGNFSVGVNAFIRIVKEAAKLMGNLDEYDAYGYELHHNQKKDSPSGTAQMIANAVVDNLKNKKKIVTEKLDRAPEKDELHFASVRGGSVPGTHVVAFDSIADTIELKHTARSRLGFALGSVMAAEFIEKKKGWFEIDDLMKDIIG